MEGELEALRQERLEHEPELVDGGGARSLSHDVIVFGGGPGGCCELVVPQAVGPPDAGSQTDIAHGQAAWRAVDGFAGAAFAAGIGAGVGFDRSDFECRLGEREACRSDREESERPYIEWHARITV